MRSSQRMYVLFVCIYNIYTTYFIHIYYTCNYKYMYLAKGENLKELLLPLLCAGPSATEQSARA